MDEDGNMRNFIFYIFYHFYIINADIEYINNPTKQGYNETELT